MADLDDLRKAIEKMSGASEEELREMAELGRDRIRTYCEGGRADIATIEKMLEIGDLATTSHARDREVVIAAFGAAQRIAANYAYLAGVLNPLAQYAIHQRAQDN